MKLKKPCLKGPGYGYLGHFAKEKFLEKGHNESPGPKGYWASGWMPPNANILSDEEERERKAELLEDVELARETLVDYSDKKKRNR